MAGGNKSSSLKSRKRKAQQVEAAQRAAIAKRARRPSWAGSNNREARD